MGETGGPNTSPTGGGLQYDAFISYSHAADGKLAPAVQNGLQRLAKPWGKRRALRVFRDETGLSVNPHLWDSIVGALDSAEWFIVLASPEAAESAWVNREIEHFLATRPDAADRLLPVVTDGVWEWDEATGGFGVATTCVPPALAAAFESEPRHLDLTWARDDDHLHLRRADFRSAIADIAAPIHGIPKDELESEDIRIDRRNRRLRRGAVSGLVVLAGGLAFASCAAFGFAKNAQRERNNAEASAAEAERQAEIAGLREIDARDAEEQALANADEAARQEAIAIQRAEEARIAQEEAIANAEEAARQETLALQREQEALDAEAAALAAQQATEEALARVIEEQRRADENARQAEANADEARVNAEEARANADEARANADEARANATEAEQQAAEAKRQQSIAEDNATTAVSRSLAARALELVAQNPELAVLTALEGIYPDGVSDRLATRDARGALGVTLRTLIENPARRTGVDLDGAITVDALSGTTATLDGTQITVSSVGDRPTQSVGVIDVGVTPEAVWFSPGADVLAAGTPTVTKMFDTSTGRLINSYEGLTVPDEFGDLHPVIVDFDRAGARFLADRGDHVAVVETRTGETLLELPKPPLPGCDAFDTFGSVSAHFDVSGSRVVGVETSFELIDCATAGAPGVPRIHAWDLDDREGPATVSLDVQAIRAWWVSTAFDNQVVFVDANAALWHWAPGSPPRMSYRSRTDSVVTVAPSAEGGQFAFVDTNGALYVGSVWDQTSRQAMSFALAPRLQWQDEHQLLVATGPTSWRQFRVELSQGGTAHDAVDRSGSMTYVNGVAADARDGTVRWTYDPGANRGDGDRPIDVSIDGSLVVNERGAILDAATGASLAQLPPQPIGFSPLAMFADRGDVVLVVTSEETRHYDSSTGALLARSVGSTSFRVALTTLDQFSVVRPSLSRDERFIARADEDGDVAVVDVRSGATRVIELRGSATSVAWSGDDRLVVGFADGSVRAASSLDGRPIGAPLVGLNGPIYGIGADSSGERLVAFDTETSVVGIERLLSGGRRVVWDVASGGVLQVVDDEAITRGVQPAVSGGFWRLTGGDWRYLPDDDVVGGCREALNVAGDELETLLGRPSVCTTLAELHG